MSNKVLIEMDLSGAEWQVVAYLANDPRMIEVCRGDESPHTITGSLISGAPIELVAREDKLLGHTTDPVELEAKRQELLPELLGGSYFVPRTMTIRQAGKKSNHGLNYGMGYRRFALENEMPETDAKRLHHAYSHEAYTRLPEWWEGIKSELRATRELVNCWGRRRHFFNEWGTELFDQAYSFIPQSTVVDIVNMAMCQAYEDESDLFEPLELLAQVHDSILVQYPAEDAGRLAAFIDRLAEYLRPTITYSNHTFRIGVDAKVGYRWGAGGMRGIRLPADPAQLEEVL